MLLLVFGVLVHPLFIGRFLVDDASIIDVSYSYMPNTHWMAQSWRAGEFPLWNPHVLCGAPHLGHTHCMGLYPVSVLLFSLLPYLWAGSITIIFHGLLVALLFFLLLRKNGVAPLLAGVGGIVFVLSGFYFGMISWNFMLGSACGFFLMWLSFQALVERPRFSWFVAGSVGAAWCVVSGDAELAAYGLSFLYLLQVLEAGPRPRALVRRVFIISLPVVCGFLLVLPMALHTMDTVNYSIRGFLMPYPIRIVSMGEHWPLTLPTWLFPFTYYRTHSPNAAYNHGLTLIYQGFLIPALFGWGLLASIRNRAYRPWITAWIILLAYTLLRSFTSTAWTVDWIPVIGDLHFAGKNLFFIHATGIIIAMRLLSDLLEPGSDEKRSRALGAVLLICGPAMAAAQPWCMPGPERYMIGIAAAIVGAAHLAGKKGKPLISIKAAITCAALLLALEILVLAFRHLPRTDPAEFRLDPGLEQYARSLGPLTRYAVFEHLLVEDLDAPPPVYGTFEVASGAGNIVGPGRVWPARIFLYMSALYRELTYRLPSGELILTNWTMTNPGTLDRGRMHLFNLAGAKTIISRDMSVPYTSPYSLLKRYSVDLSASAGKMEIDPGKETATMHAPAMVAAPVTTLPGDNIKIMAGSELGGWLQISAGPEGAGPDSIIIARHAAPVSEISLAAPIAADRVREISLALACLPAADRPADLEISTLDIESDERAFLRVGKWGSVEAFENSDALPRAFIVHKAITGSGRDSVLKIISDPEGPPLGEVVVLEEKTPEAVTVINSESHPAWARQQEGVEIKTYRPHLVEMEAWADRAAFLVFTDTCFPGWRAYLGEGSGRREVRIHPADLAFRAVFLPEGVSRITWIYRPLSFEVGLWAALASLFALVIFPVLWKSKKMR